MMSCQRYIEELRAIEDSLILIIDEASEGYLTENTKDRLVQLESRKKKNCMKKKLLGDLRVVLFGLWQEMTIQKKFIMLQKARNLQILYGNCMT